jgi:transcriptional regulator with XRE-family HTH domain
MKNKRRHTPLEIERKLKEAEALDAEGRTQKEIARALGISVMTFHRWRNAQPVPQLRSRATVVVAEDHAAAPAQRQARIAELQLENTRLRKLVTDLLLEKLKLEEELQQSLRPLN